jgi:hypothetical protein
MTAAGASVSSPGKGIRPLKEPKEGTTVKVFTPTPTTSQPLPNTKPSAFAAMARAANEVESELGKFESIDLGDFVDRATAKLTEAERISLKEAFDRLAARYPNQMMAALDRQTSPERAAAE